MAEKYVASTDLIVGDKLMIFVETETGVFSPIAFGTSCGVDISGDTIDTSSKMSGAWKESLVGQLGWTVQSDSLLSLTSGQLSFDSLKTLMASREPVKIAIGKVTKNATSGEYEKEATSFVEGSAIITSISMKADNGAICTSSITLTGTGELS